MVAVLPWLAKSVRPMLRAAPGHIFRGADLSSIESRANAWNAGETWKLDAYRLEDLGMSYGGYIVTAANIIGIHPSMVTPAQRQAQGKVPDLACGFQGSVGAFVSMGANYGTRAEDVADIASQTTPPEVWARTSKTWRPNNSAGLPVHIWTGIKVVVDGWRAKHSATVQSWWDLQDAAISAVSQPGEIIPACRVKYLSSGGFLWCQMPNGEAMAYPQPRLVRKSMERMTPCATIEQAEHMRQHSSDGDAEIVIAMDGTIYFVEKKWQNAVEVWGIEKGQWRPYVLYGGMQCENISQRIARDVLAAKLKRVKQAGYAIVLHAHDEVLCECPLNFGSSAELVRLLSMPEDWTDGLPLNAKGWEDERYVK